MERICESCKNIFPTHPKVPDQIFCGKIECQKARRRRWQRQKYATDKTYKENQAAAQKAWQKRNPDYCKQYRKDHLEYTKKNRKIQKQRNEKRKRQSNLPAFVKSIIANMDELINGIPLISGHYILIPANSQHIAKMDYLLVKIDIISKR
jgi:hypothetical protein